MVPWDNNVVRVDRYLKQVLFTSIFLIVTLWTIITRRDASVLHYYTYWAWTLHTIFFLVTTIGLFRKEFLKFGIRWLLLTSYGTAWIVLIEVTIILAFNTKSIDADREVFQLGMVFCGHVVMHAMPIITDLLYFSYSSKEITTYLTEFRPQKNLVAWYLYQLLSPVGFQLIYRFVNDPHLVYGDEVPEWIGWTVAIFVSMFVNFGCIIRHSMVACPFSVDTNVKFISKMNRKKNTQEIPFVADIDHDEDECTINDNYSDSYILSGRSQSKVNFNHQNHVVEMEFPEPSYMTDDYNTRHHRLHGTESDYNFVNHKTHHLSSIMDLSQ